MSRETGPTPWRPLVTLCLGVAGATVGCSGGPSPAPIPSAASLSADDPRTGLADQAPDKATQALRSLAPSDQFGAAFAYGEGLGVRVTLPEAVERCQPLARGLDAACLDGVAHTWAPPATDDSALVTLLRQTVPRSAQLAFYDGVLRHRTHAAAGDPAVVVPTARAFAQTAGTSPDNGVRVGLQRAWGHDLPRALALAASYPPEWHAALSEELGWRAGDDDHTWRTGVCSLAELAPDRCAFVHGAARGRVLRSLWSDFSTAEAFATELSDRTCGCPQAAWRGVAWALALSFDHRPNQAQHRAGELPEDGGRVAVLDHLRALRGPQRGAMWHGIPAGDSTVD